MRSYGLKDAQIFLIFGDIVHDDVLGSKVFQLEQYFEKNVPTYHISTIGGCFKGFWEVFDPNDANIDDITLFLVFWYIELPNYKK